MDEHERIVKIYAETIEHNDKINRRLVTCIMAITISFCVAITVICAFVSWIYFTADYYYPNITTQYSDNTNNTIGGE